MSFYLPFIILHIFIWIKKIIDYLNSRVDIGVPEGSQGAMFSPVPVDLIQYPPEAVACK